MADRSFRICWLVFLSLSCALPGCAGTRPSTVEPGNRAAASQTTPSNVVARRADGRTKRIVHVIVCWLRRPGDRTDRQRLIDVSKSFAAIPGVVDVRCGPPVPSTRSAVDSSFDLAVVMTFDGPDSLKAYQSDAMHIKATREILMPLTDRLVMYDFTEE